MGRRTRIKICGVTRPEDAILAADLGADLIGLNFFSGSPRCVDTKTARGIASRVPVGVEIVGVFVNEETPKIRHIAWEVGLTAVQFHGEELAFQVFRIAPLRVIKAFRANAMLDRDVDAFLRACESNIDEQTEESVKPSALLFDAPSHPTKSERGGTGEAWDFSQLKSLQTSLPIFLAGGLRPANVSDAIRSIRPYAVDVASGVESGPGIKDEKLMAEFIAAVRSADHDA